MATCMLYACYTCYCSGDMHVTRMYVQFKMKSDTDLTGYLLVMCDNDFTTLSIIMMILA